MTDQPDVELRGSDEHGETLARAVFLFCRRRSLTGPTDWMQDRAGGSLRDKKSRSHTKS
jgi:hypothetical protein